MLNNIDWDGLKSNTLLGLGIASFCGVTYLFGGFGMVKTYDPIKAEIVDWSPIGNMLTPKSYKLKIRLVSEFYEKYPDTKVTKLTSQDVLDELEKYCTARLGGWQEKDMNRWANLQKQLLLEKGISSDLIAGVYQRFETIHALTEKYSCSNLNWVTSFKYQSSSNSTITLKLSDLIFSLHHQYDRNTPFWFYTRNNLFVQKILYQ